MDIDDVDAAIKQCGGRHQLTLHLVVALLLEVLGRVQRFVGGEHEVEVEGRRATALQPQRARERFESAPDP